MRIPRPLADRKLLKEKTNLAVGSGEWGAGPEVENPDYDNRDLHRDKAFRLRLIRAFASPDRQTHVMSLTFFWDAGLFRDSPGVRVVVDGTELGEFGDTDRVPSSVVRGILEAEFVPVCNAYYKWLFEKNRAAWQREGRKYDDFVASIDGR